LAYIKATWNFADLNTKALEEIWQQTKARDDAREMEEHVKRLNDTRRTQRAEETAKERELLRLGQ
jgi:hypothetical protein